MLIDGQNLERQCRRADGKMGQNRGIRVERTHQILTCIRREDADPLIGCTYYGKPLAAGVITHWFHRNSTSARVRAGWNGDPRSWDETGSGSRSTIRIWLLERWQI